MPCKKGVCPGGKRIFFFMPQLTIDVPETLMPLLASKAEACGETPEAFIVSYLSDTLEYHHENVTVLTGGDSDFHEQLEDLLEERDKGTFVPVSDDLVERVLEKAKWNGFKGKTLTVDYLRHMHPDVGEVDLVGIAEYVAMGDPDAARRAVSAIGDMFKLLADQPLLGSEDHSLRQSLKGIRMIMAANCYTIYYRPLAENGGARILCVLGGAYD